jgi:hypothetical protein
MSTATLPGEQIYFAHTLSNQFKELEIIPFNDVHYKDPLFSLKHLTRTRDYVLSKPNVCLVGVGDYCNIVTKNSVGDIYSQEVTPQEQRDWIIDFFMPVKDRILGVVSGNHDDRCYKETGIDIVKDMARAWGCPYRSEGMLIKVSFGAGAYRMAAKPYTYYIYMTHGYGGARTKSAKAVKVERTSSFIHADAYIMAHDHTVNIAPDIYLIPENKTHLDKATGFTMGKVRAVRKMLIKSNGYLKWGGYGERGGFSPVDLEPVLLKLQGTGKPRIKVEV